MLWRVAYFLQKLAAVVLIGSYGYALWVIISQFQAAGGTNDWPETWEALWVIISRFQAGAALALCISFTGTMACLVALFRPFDGYKSSHWSPVFFLSTAITIGLILWLFIRETSTSPSQLAVPLFAALSLIAIHGSMAIPDLRNRKFSLRSLMLAILVLAVAGTLVANSFHSKWKRYQLQKPIVDAIEKRGGATVYFDSDWNADSLAVYVPPLAEVLEKATELQTLHELSIGSFPIADAEVELIVRMKSLKTIKLLGATLTPEGKERLRAQLPGVRVY